MKSIVLLLGIFSIGVILFACAPKVVPVEKPESGEVLTKEVPAVIKEAWEVEWEKTLAEARKEGKISIYGISSVAVREAISQNFFKRTGIKVDMVSGRGGEITAKLLTERGNGLFLADVYVGGTQTILLLLKPAGVLSSFESILFLPEVLDTKLWFQNTLPWLDRDKLILQTRLMPGGSQTDVVFNTNFASKSEFKSWYDLLTPRFKGKMNLQDPTVVGKGAKFINKALTFYGLDWDYIRAMAKQEPFITRDERLMVEWVARGKHIVSVNPDHTIYEEFKVAGAPIDGAILKETKDILGGGAAGISLIDRASHPKAAKLFINWFLSREGQTVFARSYGIQSAREDVLTDHLSPEKIRKSGVEYAIETEEFVFQEEKFRPMVLEIFGPLLAR